MSVFSSSIAFKFPWREYQQRVIDDLNLHLGDDHLHIIAPPGSGKTVLGLEVMLRIGEPTLILAPTLAVRNQWVQRFCELFIQDLNVPNWVSTDIRNPQLLTVVTYQGLHAACNNKKEQLIHVDYEHDLDVKERKKSNFLDLTEIVDKLKRIGIKTLIVDESHHLKNEWWKTLTKIKKALQPKIVGLTATPPYDVSPLEWQRYLELNGPIDAEITVPELVKVGDLCKHQDYIYLCEADEVVQQEIDTYYHSSASYYQDLLMDDVLFEAISNHPIWINPLQNEKLIYNSLSHYSACLIYLHHQGVGIHPLHLQILGINALKKSEIVEDMLKVPTLTKEWMRELLTFFLFEKNGFFQQHYDEHRKGIEKKLRRLGLLEKSHICFDYNARITQQLTGSINKLNAIEEIVELEKASLGTTLRQVILTDYIRKEYISSGVVNDIPLKRIGVFSIFEKLRRKQVEKLGVITGSIIVIPFRAMERYMSIAKIYAATDIKIKKLSYDNKYIEVFQTENSKNLALQILTQLFEEGEIQILIGTKSLLGEGWDAPAINSLILASFVGSYVASNQMRGRAIRTQFNNPRKTSNIWHIVAIDKSSTIGGVDLGLMKRRFRNFVGVSEYIIPNIENGTNRLLLPIKFKDNTLSDYKKRLINLASDRNRLHQHWDTALQNGYNLVEEIQIPYLDEKPFQIAKTATAKKYIGNMISGLASSVLFFFESSTQAISKMIKVMPGTSAGYAFMGMFGVAAVFYGRQTYRTFHYYRRYRDITKDIYRIGNALLKTLCKSKIIITTYDELKVLTYGDDGGNVLCHLEGGTAFERSSFIHMLQEIINPIHEPRFIIERKSKSLHLFNQKDYHAVPEIIGKRVALANDFLIFWKEEVGDAELYNTKSLIGRQVLIRAKFDSLSNHFNQENQVEYLNVWK
jgi:superfamily II DNA or RNA helicase